MKNQKGITLVSLIITVIVMVILAGVAIAAVVNQNGLMNKVQESINIQKNAEENETLAVNEYQQSLENWFTNLSL